MLLLLLLVVVVVVMVVLVLVLVRSVAGVVLRLRKSASWCRPP